MKSGVKGNKLFPFKNVLQIVLLQILSKDYKKFYKGSRKTEEGKPENRCFIGGKKKGT